MMYVVCQSKSPNKLPQIVQQRLPTTRKLRPQPTSRSGNETRGHYHRGVWGLEPRSAGRAPAALAAAATHTPTVALAASPLPFGDPMDKVAPLTQSAWSAGRRHTRWRGCWLPSLWAAIAWCRISWCWSCVWSIRRSIARLAYSRIVGAAILATSFAEHPVVPYDFSHYAYHCAGAAHASHQFTVCLCCFCSQSNFYSWVNFCRLDIQLSFLY
jgi:hypothetical protein